MPVANVGLDPLAEDQYVPQILLYCSLRCWQRGQIVHFPQLEKTMELARAFEDHSFDCGSCTPQDMKLLNWHQLRHDAPREEV